MASEDNELLSISVEYLYIGGEGII